MHDYHLHLEHITRVEGHGNVVINIKKGQIEELRLDIVESPRFFEAMVLGRNWDEVAHITSRICGICAVTHTTTSLKAIEEALGVIPSEQTIRLRKLMLHGEYIQSHILHLYFLAAPDFFGAKSVFGMLPDHKEIVARGMRLKKMANELCALIGGRHVHPCSMVVGGFTAIPEPEKLQGFRERLVNARPDMEATVELFKRLNTPDFQREVEYISITHPNEYAFYDGRIKSSLNGTTQPSNYLDRVKEYIVPHSTAKHARSTGETYRVGALARVHNNYEKLHPKAKEAAQYLGVKPPCHNPFMNNQAQVVEGVYCLEDGIKIIDALLKDGLKEEKLEIKPREGRGVGVTEAPRGTLFHEHRLDNKGIVTYGNYIIPTAQNLANIERDLWKLVPEILDKPKEEITMSVEMLVRSYDPCISCASHLMEVRFV
ncbi:MAG TPA: Ni/Fe hydrogenase subunit alpha [Candidatus Hypogeohydataceae bacterium YC41]